MPLSSSLRPWNASNGPVTSTGARSRHRGTTPVGIQTLSQRAGLEHQPGLVLVGSGHTDDPEVGLIKGMSDLVIPPRTALDLFVRHPGLDMLSDGW